MGSNATLKSREKKMPAESVLIPVIKAFGEDYFSGISRGSRLSSQTEINAGYGIADVVFYDMNDDVVHERQHFPLQPIHSEEIIRTLLLLKNKRTFSVTYLKNALPFSEAKLKNHIVKFLEDRQVIRRFDDGSFSMDYRYSVGLNTSIAIEAKVKDWQRGLYQAYRYRWFSDVSYLAIYRDYIGQPKKNLHLFRRLNIGLMSVDEADAKIIFRPRKEKPKSLYLKAIAFEKILERIF